MDVFSSFEETLRQVAPLLLAIPGLILGVAGLFLWLGGLRLLRPLAAFVAGVAGFACAWAFTGRELLPLVSLTVIPATIALFVDKPIVVLLGAALAAAAVLVFPLFADAALQQAVYDRAGPLPTAEDSVLFEAKAYLETVWAWAVEWGKVYWAELADGWKIGALAAAVGIMAAGLVAWRWVCALTCATLGTAMILLGLTAVVLSKGTQTIPYLEDIRQYLWIATAGMIAAGTIFNRLLCPAKADTKKTKESHEQGDEK